MKPTPGPWEVENQTCITAGGYIIDAVCGNDTSTQQDAANAALIVAAVNACFAQNASDPIKVAENVGKMVELLKVLASWASMRSHLDCNCDDCQARAILTACGIEWRETK
jgi:hypothetical protein